MFCIFCNNSYMYIISDQILFDEHSISLKVKELAQKISSDYENENNLLLICILKGSYIFTADLSRKLDIDHDIDFMATSSYREDTKPQELKIIKDIELEIKGRHILIVEDIIDSGQTIEKVVEILKARKPESIEICSLLNKPDKSKVDIHIKYKGFDIPDKFVIGYGMDYDEKYRNLNYIGYLEELND